MNTISSSSKFSDFFCDLKYLGRNVSLFSPINSYKKPSRKLSSPKFFFPNKFGTQISNVVDLGAIQKQLMKKSLKKQGASTKESFDTPPKYGKKVIKKLFPRNSYRLEIRKKNFEKNQKEQQQLFIGLCQELKIPWSST